MRIIRAEFFDIAEKRCNRKAIKTSIDFAYFLLRCRQRILLHDGLYFFVLGTLADDSAVPGRIIHPSCEQRHSRVARYVEVAELLDSRGSYERSIPGKHDDNIIRFKCFASGHQRMASSALLFLQYEVNSAGSH